MIAREIARVLNAREPKIINGPEILDKYVGEAERNIRALFQDAEDEWKALGSRSQLHVIIFDEIDSIAKKRGSLVGDQSGVRDSCVNQLLSQLDGVRSGSNVLVIGLTNRPELLDPALLRPGRLEVHLEIKLPDYRGRVEILSILFRAMYQAGVVTEESLLEFIPLISRKTKHWSGADLAGLVRSIGSYAMQRAYSERAISFESSSAPDAAITSISSIAGKRSVHLADIKVTRSDIDAAMKDVSTSLSLSSSSPSWIKWLSRPLRWIRSALSSQPRYSDDGVFVEGDSILRLIDSP